MASAPTELDALLEAVGQEGDRVLAPLLDLEEVDDVLDAAAVLHLLTTLAGPHQAAPASHDDFMRM